VRLDVREVSGEGRGGVVFGRGLDGLDEGGKGRGWRSADDKS